MAKPTGGTATTVRIALRARDGSVVPRHDYGSWGLGRARRAFREIGYRLVGTRGDVAAGDLLAVCEAFLDRATSEDAIALCEFAGRAVAYGGEGAMVGVGPEHRPSLAMAG